MEKVNNWLWILTALSIIGTVLNIKKIKVCFIIWSFTNLMWCIVDFIHGMYAQAFLFFVYFGLAVWGIIEWSKDKNKGE